MRLIVGLGNPGIAYKGTRHNIGSEVVLNLAKENKIKMREKAHFSLIGRGKISGEDVVLVLPQTFMNLSGKAVKELYSRECKDISEILVVCDDINLELGKIRLRHQGSSGGQKGLESIVHSLGREDFARLRIGIATEVHRGDISGYVLSPFKRKDRRHVAHIVTLATDAITYMLEKGMDKAMSTFNKKKAGTS